MDLPLRLATGDILGPPMAKPQPQIIEKDGKTELDRLQEHDRFLAAVEEGLADSEAGRLIDDETLAAELEPSR